MRKESYRLLKQVPESEDGTQFNNPPEQNNLSFKEVEHHLNRLDPVLQASIDIIQSNSITLNRNPSTREYDVKVDAIKRIVDKYGPVFSSEADRGLELYEEFELPLEEESREVFTRQKKEIISIAKKLGLLAPNFEETARQIPDLEIYYSNPGKNQYFDADLAVEMGLVEGEPKSIISIGARELAIKSQELLELAERTQIKISPKKAFEIVSLHNIGHESLHYLQDVYGSNVLEDRALDLTDDLEIDFDEDYDLYSVISERIAQSFANTITRHQLKEEGYETGEMDFILDYLNRTSQTRVEQYRALANLAKDQGLPPSAIDNAFRDARVNLRKKGEHEIVSSFFSGWRKMGYHLPVYDFEQIQYIFNQSPE